MKEKYNFFDVIDKPQRIKFVDPLVIATDFLEEASKDEEMFYQYISMLKMHVPYIYRLLIFGSNNNLAPISNIMEDSYELLDKFNTKNIKNRDSNLKSISQTLFTILGDVSNKKVNDKQFKNFIGKMQNTLPANEYYFMQMMLHQSFEYGKVFENNSEYIQEQSHSIYMDHAPYLEQLVLPFVNETNKNYRPFKGGKAEKIIKFSKNMKFAYHWHGLGYQIYPEKKIDDLRVVEFNIAAIAIRDPGTIATMSLFDDSRIFQIVPNYPNIPEKSLADCCYDWATNIDSIEYLAIVSENNIVRMERKNINNHPITNFITQPTPFSTDDSTCTYGYWEEDGKKIAGIVVDPEKKDYNGYWAPFNLARILV